MILTLKALNSWHKRSIVELTDAAAKEADEAPPTRAAYSVTTAFTKFRGLSTSIPRRIALK